MHSEKLASMGQLAAGIAHEVNNPLGVVLLYAHLLLEECAPDSEMGEDLKLIVDQADRCKRSWPGCWTSPGRTRWTCSRWTWRAWWRRPARGCLVPEGTRSR